jgi:hypothetical protein
MPLTLYSEEIRWRDAGKQVSLFGRFFELDQFKRARWPPGSGANATPRANPISSSLEIGKRSRIRRTRTAAYAANFSRSAFASFRSRVSKPSVNQRKSELAVRAPAAASLGRARGARDSLRRGVPRTWFRGRGKRYSAEYLAAYDRLKRLSTVTCSFYSSRSTKGGGSHASRPSLLL